MTLSAKWTTVTFFALTALGGGSFLFGGCTVTSGPVTNDEGGIGNPPVDGGGGTDTSTVDTGTPSACDGNMQVGKFTPPACQAALETSCCDELKACFNAVVDKTDAAAPQGDCNAFFACLADCEKPLGDGAAPTPADVQECQTTLCDANSPQNIRDAYDAITTCGTQKANTVCQ